MFVAVHFFVFFVSFNIADVSTGHASIKIINDAHLIFHQRESKRSACARRLTRQGCFFFAFVSVSVLCSSEDEDEDDGIDENHYARNAMAASKKGVEN